MARVYTAQLAAVELIDTTSFAVTFDPADQIVVRDIQATYTNGTNAGTVFYALWGPTAFAGFAAPPRQGETLQWEGRAAAPGSSTLTLGAIGNGSVWIIVVTGYQLSP